MKISRCPTGITGIAGPEKPFEGSGLGNGLGGEAVSDLGDELVEGDPAAGRFGLEAGVGLGGKIERHGHVVDCRGRRSQPDSAFSALLVVGCQPVVVTSSLVVLRGGPPLRHSRTRQTRLSR